jgi:hypothetical protein
MKTMTTTMKALFATMLICLCGSITKAQLTIGCGPDNSSCENICMPTVRKVEAFRSGNTLFCSSGISYCAQGCTLGDDPNQVYNWSVMPNVGSYTVIPDLNGFARINLSAAYTGVPVTVCLSFDVNPPFPFTSPCESNTLCFGPM